MPASWILTGVTIAVLALVVGTIGRYFALVRARNRVQEARSSLDVHLARANRRDDIDETVGAARQLYNRLALDYNTRLETYPDALIAGAMDFAHADLFGAGLER